MIPPPTPWTPAEARGLVGLFIGLEWYKLPVAFRTSRRWSVAEHGDGVRMTIKGAAGAVHADLALEDARVRETVNGRLAWLVRLAGG